MNYDLIIIGAGPAGYEGAHTAAKHGKRVALIERDHLGGTCLNRGCIPTKCLLHSAQEHQPYDQAVKHKDETVATLRGAIDGMMAGVTVYNGTGAFTGPNTVSVEGQEITAPQIIIATGSKPSRLPIAGAEMCMTSDDLLACQTLPQSIVIIGGGVIGVEFASLLNGFGVEVTVIEYCKEILPGFDADLAKRLRTMLTRRGIKIVVGAAVQEVRPGYEVDYQGKKGVETVQAEAVLMAVGRRAVMPEGLDKAGIEATPKGIVVNDQFETTAKGVYAVGDCIGRTMLAHVASAQMATVLGHKVDLAVVPAVVFTDPELAMVGATEEALKAAGTPYKVAKVMVGSNGKALSMGYNQGLLKLIVTPEGDKILGCSALAPDASDIITEPALCMANGLGPDAIARTIHSHPSLNELMLAAAQQC